MIPNLDKSWRPIVSLLYQEPLVTLNTTILPNISFQPRKENIFKVFETPVNKIRVVILGQDPYPTPGVAIGRSFAVSEDTKIPVSLRIIQEEIIKENQNYFSRDEEPYWKTLQHWQDQGVFLLNAALTVETGNAGSHLKYWEYFTQRVVSYISVKQPCIWLLWGQKAQKFKSYISNPFSVKDYDRETIKQIPSNSDWNYILESPHPAAEAYSGGKAGFFGNNHFIFTNEILNKLSKKQINW